MHNKILLPIDGSEDSFCAIDYCIKLLKNIKPEKIVLLHVAAIPSQLESYSGKLGAAFYKMKDQLQEYGEEILNNAKKEIIDKNIDIPIETKMIWGQPQYEIVKETEKGNYDLVIMSNRGLSGIKGFFIGSVSNYVIHHVQCTVIIVKKRL